MNKLVVVFIILAGILIPQNGVAQAPYDGTYTLTSGQTTLTIIFQQSGNTITGTLSSTTGVTYQMQGEVMEGTAAGVCSSSGGSVFFEAYLDGTTLTFAMIEPDANNMPDYDQVQYLSFTKSEEQVAQGNRTQGVMGDLFGEQRENNPPGDNPQNNRQNNNWQGNNQGQHTNPNQGTGTPSISENEIGDPSWGFKFPKPAGWVHQQSAEGAVLGHNTIPGMIIVFVHMAENMQQMQQEMMQGIQEEGSYLMPGGSLQPSGNNILTGDYSGSMDGTQVKAKGYGVLSPYGGGAYILAVSTPEALGSDLIGAAGSIAQNMQYFKVETGDLMNHFAGNWTHHTSNTSTYIFFGPDGSYSNQYESSYSGDFTDGAGNYTGGWNAMGNDKSQGRWTVRGNKESGTIIVKLNNGEEIYYEYRVHKEKGYTYYNEYWFNGDHYAKNR